MFFAILSMQAQDTTYKLTPSDFNVEDKGGSKISLLERNATLYEDLYWSGTNTTLYLNSKSKATYSGWVKAYYKNELTTKLRKLSYYINGRPVETITFKPSGQRCTETTLKNGNGRETHWHPNGTKREISNYQNGLANGDFKLWYANGNLEAEGAYLNGFLQGKLINYNEDGSAKSVEQFEKGKFLSTKPPWSSFHFSSLKEEAFWNELVEWEIIDESMRRNKKGEVIDSKATNAFTGYAKERIFLKKGGTTSGVRILSSYKNGYLERCKSWDQSGKKNYDFNYKLGQQDGLSVAWHANGQKKTEQNFKDGKLDGFAFEWYENRQKKSEVYFKVGKMHGVATEWYENGQKKLETHFNEGKRHGTFKAWRQDGLRYLEADFKEGQIQK
jgi:antitoxin component YwqK of YwqJK toxin-antitoxin module